MRPIVSDIITFSQHLNALEHSLDLYRPSSCQHCNAFVIWFHGYYYRKPDRLNHGAHSANDIPIPRFQCAACRHTFSTLPECLAPARWYPWAIQQWCLWFSLNGWSVKQLSQTFPMARSTIKRWIDWLNDSFKKHQLTLCSEVSSMGYFSTCPVFWCHWLGSKDFSQAMLLINKKGLSVP